MALFPVSATNLARQQSHELLRVQGRLSLVVNQIDLAETGPDQILHKWIKCTSGRPGRFKQILVARSRRACARGTCGDSIAQDNDSVIRPVTRTPSPKAPNESSTA